jgi:hypothetical protein
MVRQHDDGELPTFEQKGPPHTPIIDAGTAVSYGSG